MQNEPTFFGKRIARVFPRKTTVTPDDNLVYFSGPGMFPPEVDEVHVSVSFSWDLPRAEQLAKMWKGIAQVKIGGPGTGMRGETYVPGLYMSHGNTITSRGCPNKCWFCSVWRRDGTTRELAITPGHNIRDDNLLSCSRKHILNVFAMLKAQSENPTFSGGLEAKLLLDWHVEALAALKPKRLYFAYDTPDDYEPLVEAGKKLAKVGLGLSTHTCASYVLCGYPKDTMSAAEKRMNQCLDAGFVPFAMLWRNEFGKADGSWRKFASFWSSPVLIFGARHAEKKEVKTPLFEGLR